jgi:hypothetical protein
LVSEFGFNTEREYEIVTTDAGEYLVDTFNQAKMARREGNGWVETDWRERYDHLLPEEPRQPYIGGGYHIGDLLYNSDTRFVSREIRPIVTGNSMEKRIFDEYQGREVIMTFLETVIRYRNEVVPFYVYAGSDDIPGTFRLGYYFYDPDGTPRGSGFYMAETTDELMQRLPPGSQVSVTFQFERPEVPIPNVPCSEITSYCIDDYAAMVGLFWRQVDALQELNRRIDAGESLGDVMEELLIPTWYLDIYTYDGVPEWWTEWLRNH